MAITRIYSVLFFFIISTISVQSVRIRVPFYHRDSSFSPFYDPTISETERFMRSVNRSLARSNHINLNTFGLDYVSISELFADEGEYVMNVSLGTPPFEVTLIVDTGSNLLWTQCLPSQNQAYLESNKASPSQEISYYQIKPLFDPTKSSTYKEFSCGSNSDGCPIKSLGTCNNQRHCVYHVGYGDGSSTYGRIASETLIMGDGMAKLFGSPNFIFGCGFHNNGIFSPQTAGIVGLGGRAESLVSQLSSKIKGQFSYCMTLSRGKQKPGGISFGGNFVDNLTIKIPLVVKEPNSYHFVTLNSFTIGRQIIRLIGSSGSIEQGNIIIDSGTMLSLIPADFYDKISRAVSSQMTVAPVRSPYSNLDLCYVDDVNFKPPKLTANFAGGDVPLSNDNFFVKLESVLCLAFIKTNGVSIYGNIGQTHFLMGFDLVQKTVSFRPDHC